MSVRARVAVDTSRVVVFALVDAKRSVPLRASLAAPRPRSVRSFPPPRARAPASRRSRAALRRYYAKPNGKQQGFIPLTGAPSVTVETRKKGVGSDKFCLRIAFPASSARGVADELLFAESEVCRDGVVHTILSSRAEE